MNATKLYEAMLGSIYSTSFARQSADAVSPMQERTIEATACQTFVMHDTEHNVPTQIDVDLRWARANALHFFASTEYAKPLYSYNRHAKRFLDGDYWRGAYGAIAMPQVRNCIKLLRRSPHSRRAIVSMGEAQPCDVNRPACWSFLHFLVQQKLETIVYQRSLNMRVMPYDCVVLTNLHRYVAQSISVEPGALHWTIGSLHMVENKRGTNAVDSILLLQYDPEACLKELEDGLRKDASRA